jgi:hypothetical protein
MASFVSSIRRRHNKLRLHKDRALQRIGGAPFMRRSDREWATSDVIPLWTGIDVARPVETDDGLGARGQPFEKLGEDEVAGDLGETNVELARRPDGLEAVAARLRLRAGAHATTKLVERFPICAEARA